MLENDTRMKPSSLRPEIKEKSQNETNSDIDSQHKEPYKMKIVWKNVAIFIVLHIFGLYGFYQYFFVAKYVTMIYFWIYTVFGGMGITGGAHRLWAHRAYKARLPMRILLMLMQSASHQNSIYVWARDHRLHHKYTDTDADPHNSKRGFFFSHMGWLVVKKHPDVRTRGAGIDMSDIASDPVIQFQRKYYYVIMPLMCFVIPTLIPYYGWNEPFNVSFFTIVFRYCISLHYTWLVNSAAHLWGYKPYDKFISPTENVVVSILTYGEGWHNYHHVFPWDYKAAELGNYRTNVTTAFIDLFAFLGLAHDLKTVPNHMIQKRIEKTGDGCHSLHHREVWGWSDKNLTIEDKECTTILRKAI